MLFHVEVKSTDINGNYTTIIHSYNATTCITDPSAKTIAIFKYDNDNIKSLYSSTPSKDFECVVAVYNIEDVIRVWNDQYSINPAKEKEERYNLFLKLKEEFKE